MENHLNVLGTTISTEKFRFMGLAYETFKADMQAYFVEHGDIAENDDDIVTTRRSGNAGSDLSKLRRNLNALEFCMDLCETDLQKVKSQQNQIHDATASFCGRLRVVKHMLSSFFNSIRDAERNTTINGASCDLLSPESEESTTPSEASSLDYMILKGQLEMLGLCFKRLQTDYAAHSGFLARKNAPLPRPGSKYIIRSVKNGSVLVGRPDHVRTAHRKEIRKAISTAREYQWNVSKLKGQFVFKNDLHGSNLGYTRASRTSHIHCLEGTVEKDFSQGIWLQRELGGGFTLWGHMRVRRKGFCFVLRERKYALSMMRSNSSK